MFLLHLPAQHGVEKGIAGLAVFFLLAQITSVLLDRCAQRRSGNTSGCEVTAGEVCGLRVDVLLIYGVEAHTGTDRLVCLALRFALILLRALPQFGFQAAADKDRWYVIYDEQLCGCAIPLSLGESFYTICIFDDVRYCSAELRPAIIAAAVIDYQPEWIDVDWASTEQVTLFDAVSGAPLELCVKIAAYYGLRRSEVLELRWSAIDMEHKTISISHKVIEAEVDGKFVPMGEDVLKTKSSFRTLPLIPAVGIILLEEKEKQEMYRRLFKKSYCRDYLDYICVDQCGKLLRPNYVTEHFSWLIEKYGLRKVRFHDLRHTCASLLLSNGISMKQIQI